MATPGVQHRDVENGEAGPALKRPVKEADTAGTERGASGPRKLRGRMEIKKVLGRK